MRPHLLDPVGSNPRLDEAIAVGREIYVRHEAGQDYTDSLTRLGLIAGRPIHSFAVHASFGSERPETFAKKQLISWDALPLEITEQEMLEMIERIWGAKGDEFQIGYWLACLRANTGDEKVSDLLFWPGAYFGDGNDDRDLSPSDILATALKSGGGHREA